MTILSALDNSCTSFGRSVPLPLSGSSTIIPSSFLSRATQSTDILPFYALPLHAHQVLLAMAMYQALYSIFVPAVFRLLFSKAYSDLKGIHRRRFLRVGVSTVQAFIASYLCIKSNIAHAAPTLSRQERLWKYEEDSATLCAYALGYFVWHFLESLVNWDDHGIPMKIHGLCTVLPTLIGLRPFGHFYFRRLICVEISNLCINLQRCLKWSGCKNTTLLATASRLALGSWAITRLVIFPYAVMWMTFDLVTAATLESATVVLTKDQLASQEIGSVTLEGTLLNEGHMPLWMRVAVVGMCLILIWESWVWFVGIWKKGEIANGKVKAS